MSRKNHLESVSMAAFARGDVQAFDEVFREYAARLHAFFARSFPDPAVADDLVQTTFLRVHASRSSFQPDMPLKPWLYQIASRVRIDELRRRYRVAPHLSDEAVEDVATDASSPAVVAEARDRAERVRAALDALPLGQRSVVYLHRVEGMTFAEIAAVLGIAEGAARVRAFRAYDRLRDELADVWEEEC